MADDEPIKTPEPEGQAPGGAETPKQEEWQVQLNAVAKEKERIQQERDAALQELGNLKKTVSGQDRKISALQRQTVTASGEELKGIQTQIEALTEVLLAEDGTMIQPLTKRERYEEIIKTKRPVTRQPNPLEGAYAAEMGDLFEKHSLEAESLPDDLRPAIDRANTQWNAGAYELALRTMERAIEQRAKKQVKENDSVKQKEEAEKQKAQEAKETKAGGLVRDRSSGAGSISPNLETLLATPTHNMSTEELRKFSLALEGAIRKGA